MLDIALKPHLKERAWGVLERIDQHCSHLIEQVTNHTTQYLADNSLPADDVCFVVVGSVGRQEALHASDIDFTPVLRTPDALKTFEPHDQPLRQQLRQALGIKVSQGEDLTKQTDLSALTAPESIGGSADDSGALTRRLLILTESRQAGGNLSVAEVRKQIMTAYAGAERTRGRHVLSLCNDLARYYRTLCIEYKAKADDPAKDWCTRNMKLRHSRKFWYFSAILSIVAIADRNPQGDEAYIEELLQAFEKPPFLRLFHAVEPQHRGLVGRILEPFAWFLDFMSEPTHRTALEKVEHKDRHRMALDNPFHAVRLNSHRLHQEMISLIDSLASHQRHRILDWFLL
ncbi:MAG: DUF294 nucleotidyltransferase-like domain-containing protein [Gemmataceae bacterium]|nr:DUF294 nucleotidyltransferase-like domain-containing protein [Gemmataceae bacterium]